MHRHHFFRTAGALALTVLGLNLLGDGLRDVLDPKTASS
jgi:ABC-type dipeptide/oligopeptide/nickel transport system permease subunit